MVSHRDPVIVATATTRGVYYAICYACGAHSPVVGDSEQALALLDGEAGAHACYLQRPLFDKATRFRREEKIWHAAA